MASTPDGSFNGYHCWLGISPKDCPPNHYRLLGIDLFESNPEVISNAADQRMARKYGDPGANRRRRSDSRGGILAGEEAEQSLEVVERAPRIDYRRHGLGRRVFFPRASRSSQA
jgi:hypothetical protein